MAINTAAFSPKEWTVSVAAETTVGTSIAANFKAMEVESFSFPTINDAVREVAPRTGTTSRIVNSGDLVYIEAGGVHEVSISGFLNKTIFPILAENACGEAKSSHIITIDYDHQPVHFLAGASGSGGHNTLSFCFEAPSGAGNDTYVLTGCMITSFTISADSSEDGRFKFDLTAQTRYPFTTTAVAQSVNTVAAFVETYLYLGDFSIKRVFNAEIILDSFGLTIENPVAFLGNSTNTGIPNAFQRSIPEFKATANCVVKYDAATDGFLNSWRTQAVQGKTDTDAVDDAVAGLYLANNVAWGSASVFGIKMDNAIIVEQPTYQEDDYMKLSVVLQAVNDEISTSDPLALIVSS